MLTFLDLFAGIGGFRLGMELAGHICLGHCELDKFANKSYKEMHNPREDEWFERDIRKIECKEIPKADCWCFGFPCQDISVAGKQQGFKGERSSLFFAVTKLVRNTEKEDRPRYLFIENVKNFLSVNGGWDFLQALIELDEIGYDAEWRILNSKDFGVPQNRERLFLIATRKDIPNNFSFSKSFKATSIKLKEVLEHGVDEKYYLKGKHLDWWERNKGMQIKKGYSSLAL
jgi:DNA (cytosine-5)-methyltransferase 1